MMPVNKFLSLLLPASQKNRNIARLTPIALPIALALISIIKGFFSRSADRFAKVVDRILRSEDHFSSVVDD